MRRAARVDENQKRIVEALREYGCTVHHIREPMDLLVGTGSHWVMMEVKDGAKPPSAQRLRDSQLEALRLGGGPISVVDSVEAALRAVRAIRGANVV
jgi:hypothetical protein